MCDYVCVCMYALVCICYVCVCANLCANLCANVYVYVYPYVYIYAHLLTNEYILFLLPCSPAPRRVQQHGQCQGPWSRPQSDEHGWWFPVVSYRDPQNLGFMTWMIWATMT